MLHQIIQKIVESNDGLSYMLGFVSRIFIDDTLLMGDSKEECVQNVNSSLVLFKTLNKSLGLFTRSSLCWSTLTKLLFWGLK